jgi:hypothetical protein
LIKETTIREVLLKVVNRCAESDGRLQNYSVLHENEQELLKLSEGQRSLGVDTEQAILTVFYDLFRSGHLAPGYNLSNSEPPFIHLTDCGRKTLENLSRDPANPEGYLGHIHSIGKINEIAKSYLNEALNSYNANCIKAAAVMIGGALESEVLELRDLIVMNLEEKGKDIPKNLQDWKMKTILDAISKEIEKLGKAIPSRLKEQIEANWSAFITQIRMNRNDAGHPSNIELITFESVHSSFLILPEIFKIIVQLKPLISS